MNATIVNPRRLTAAVAVGLAVVLAIAGSSRAAPETELVSLAITNAGGADLLGTPFDPAVTSLDAGVAAGDATVTMNMTGPPGSCITVTSAQFGGGVGCFPQGIDIPMTIPTGIWTIIVALTGETSTVYTLAHHVVGGAPSSNADLGSLTLSQGTLTPTFAAGTTTYGATVAYPYSSVSITPTVADSTATLKVKGTAATSGAAVPVALSVGANAVDVEGRAQDGTTKTTTVTITRAAPSTNNNLATLVVSEGTLAPAFAPATTGYTASVVYLVESVRITPTVADSTATLKVDGSAVASGGDATVGLIPGQNDIHVEVTAQDGSKRTTTVRITRAQPSDDATLATLALSVPGLMPSFSPWLTGYWAWAINATQTVHASATVHQTSATLSLTMNGVPASLGADLPLTVGHNVLDFRVIAQDGLTIRDYIVDVQRLAAAPPSPPPPPASTNPATPPTSTTPGSVSVIPVEPDESRSLEPGSLPPVKTPDYATSRQVELAITAPEGATEVMISNTSNFVGAKTVAVSLDGTYPWTLAKDGPLDGKRTVYVRFVGAGVDAKQTVTSQALVDDRAPVLKTKGYVDERRIKGRRTRVWLSLASTDVASGVAYGQLARDRSEPWAWFPYAESVTLRSNPKTAFVWARTADAAGNVSAWKKLSFPKKPVLHPSG